ncbi:hypothetical protein GPECTOR_34g699 [Gonium pectorale]|uniref:Uncharacterized protein n=1 Tax=Gonium pectorale TaxID=33097 RepID=A0A150GDW4_GONPE|nr:hypothetical protein GPECTOR_34g699 [Gonium pectorale]|eukprot:KXZ47540.1 hypothetical protein GPECTOR_34g699 [Gonium pectorale]
MAAEPASFAPELPAETKTIKALTLQSLKRTYDLFVGNYGQPTPLDESSQLLKAAVKFRDEYSHVSHLVAPVAAPKATVAAPPPAAAGPSGRPAAPGAAAAAAGEDGTAATRPESRSSLSKLIDNIPAAPAAAAGGKRPGESAAGQQVVLYQPAGGATAGAADAAAQQRAVMAVIADKGGNSSAAVSRRLASKWPKPEWHAPWKMYRVISGHLGWVRCVAVDPGNEWFATGSADRTIKIWDLASGQLKLTLTGHIEQVTGLAVSARHPYMFSCGLDKMVKCWDLEQNKVIRNYHGHLSGVYCIALHPSLDILMTGGRDSVVRVWDMRSKVQAMVLSGHDQTVCSLLSQAPDPQVISGSHDSTIRLWDIRKGKASCVLTHHKKSIRAMAMHPHEFAFASASAENIKKWALPSGDFLHNMLSQQRAIINSMAINQDGVIATGGDNGSLWWWDWRSGHCFQQDETVVQPGSLESEATLYDMVFDASGSRLITAEGDKTVKMWKEVEDATPETHPGLPFRPPKDIKRF